MKNLLIKTICIILVLSGTTANAQLFTNYTTVDGLPDNYIVGGVAVDTNNNKWFGTAAGVAKYNNATWTTYTTVDGLINNYTNCIAVDKSNNVWVGTASGVSKYNGTTWTSYTTADGLIDNGVVYISVDIDSSIWFATSYGVSKLKNSIWTNFTTVEGLPTNIITYIANDQNGYKWFGTQMGGVSFYNNTIFTNITNLTMDSLLDNNVFAVASDESNQKWIGTWYGITVLDSANNWIKNLRTADGLYNNYVRDIKLDTNDHIWVAFFADYNQDGGISGFNGTNWYSYSMADGLANNQIIRLAIDKNNIVWIATGNGVSKFNANMMGINSIASETKWNVYPNPATDEINISTSGSKVKDILLCTIVGQEVLHTNQLTFNVSHVSNGVYFIKVITENGEGIKKIIINH